jgi:serine/threonine protein kinase/WD40 repeat protein
MQQMRGLCHPSLIEAYMTTLRGQVIRGYELHELIGAGGFGEVYRATQTAVDREVAIKIILPQYANQPEFIRRFEAEARTVARLEHLHIVSLYDYWRDPTGAYLVLRWLRGGSLKDYIAERGALPAPTVARIFSQIAGALSTAHRLGVVHRDVKPANILLDDEQNAYLSDFGIAKSSLEEKSAQSKATSESSLTGSAGYISPEQINLAPITPRSDIYSMTLVLYEMLTGQHAYPEATTSIALFVKHTNERLPIVPMLPDQINNILQKGAAKNADDRYDDIMTMAGEFRDAVIATGLVNVKSSGGIVHDFDTSSFMNAVGFRPEDIVNPYKGLHAFQESDAEDFFGRETLTADILDKMDENHPLARFIAVVGPSGSGKSSVVKAGVVPELRKDALPGSEDWYYVEMVPGANPMVELQEALTRVSAAPLKNLHERLMADPKALHQVVKEIVPLASELLIVIDQFEEAFTFGDERVRSHFLQSLYEAIVAEDSQLRVITTLRADFYDRPLSEARFGQLIQQRTVVVLPLSVEEVERAITAPASQVQVFYERGLPAQIVTEVIDQPGVLPMLQYALTELFERREDQLLTHKAYQDIGGVLGALARRAEEIYRELDEEHQEATVQLFLRLVTLGEGSEDTRRRALQSEIMAASPNKKVMQEVIDMFSGFRLLTTDRDPSTRTPTVEVAHEALIRQWQRLRGWLSDTREDVRLQRLLAAESQEWDENNRDASFLLRGGRLVQFEDWYKSSSVALTPTDIEFIEASVAERQRVEEADRIRLLREREAERKARRNLQLLLVGAFIALIVAGALAFLAFQQSSAARRAEVVALDAQQTAIVQVTDVAQAQANAESNLVTAEAAGTEAALQADNASTQQALAEFAAADAVNAQGQAEQNLIEANVLGTEAALNLVVAEAAGTEAAAQANIASTQQSLAEDAAAEAAANAAESRSLALAGSSNDLLGQNSPLALFLAMEANRGLNEEQVSPLSRRVLSLAAFSAPRQRFAVDAPVTSVIFLPFEGVSPDNNPVPPGLQAISGTADGRIMLWDVREGTSQTLEGGHTSRINEIVINPTNPNMLASVGNDGVGIIWSISDGIEARRLASGSSNVPANTIAFNTEGTQVAIGYADGNVVIFDTNGSQIVQLPQVSANAVNSIVFRPDTSNDMVIAFDDTTRYWDAGLSIFIPFDLGNILARLGKVQAVAFSDDTTSVLTSTSAPLFFLSELSFGESGESVLTSQSDVGNRPQLWSIDVDNLQREDNNVRPVRVSYPEHLGQVTDVSYSPNGDFLVSAAADGSVFLVDAGTGQLVRRLLAHEASVWDAAFSSDGRFILTGGADNVMYLWDFNTNIGNEETYDGVGEGDVINASVSQVRFTEDGRIFSGSDRGEVALWGFENYTPEFAQPLVQSEVPQVVYRVLETTDETTGESVIRLLSGSLDMRYYDMASSEILASYDRDEATAFVNDIAITSDGKLAVWAGGYFQRVESRDALNRDIRIPILTLWDTQTGQVVRNFDVLSLQTEQSDIAATPTPTPEAAVDVEATATEDANQQVDNSITAVALYPDGTKMVTGDEFGRIIIWDLNTGERLTELEGHTDIISVLRFNDDGTQLLSGSADRIIILWRIDADVVRSFQQRRFIGHTDLINDVDFSPVDAENAASINTIVSGSEDRRVIQWDATTGEILQILAEQSNPITTVQFTPDGKGVVFGTLDGRVVYKGIDSPEEIITWSENNRYVPQLTCPQAEQYNIAVEGCETGS